MLAISMTPGPPEAAPRRNRRPAGHAARNRQAWRAIVGWSGIVGLGALQWTAMAIGLGRLLA